MAAPTVWVSTQVHVYPETRITAKLIPASDGLKNPVGIVRVGDATVDVYLSTVEECDRLIAAAQEVRAGLEP